MSVHKLSQKKMSTNRTSTNRTSSDAESAGTTPIDTKASTTRPSDIPPDTIAAEARQWLIRLDSDTSPSQADKVALSEWVGRSPAHHQELVRISMFWNEANVLTELSIPLQASASQTSKDNQQAQEVSDSLGGFWSGIAGLVSGRVNAVANVFANKIAMSVTAMALVVVVLINGPFATVNYSDSNGIYVAAIGEVVSQTLADGTVLKINTDSQVQVDYSESVRKIRLLRGEAHFAVAHNKTWPFEVYAGKGRVKAVGTAFSVQLSDDMVEVLVSEGRVDLAAVVHNLASMHSDENGSIENHVKQEKEQEAYTPALETIGSLDMGQQARFYNRALTSTDSNTVNADAAKGLIEQINTLADEELERRLAWRSGYLVFSGDPLSQVVEEINRYTPMQVEISDPALRDIKIGGRFKVGELDAMLSVFESSFAIRVSRLDDQHIQLLAK